AGIGHRRRTGEAFDVEGHQQGLESRGADVGNDLLLLPADPGLLPVPRQRLGEGALRGHPLRGPRIAVQIDPTHFCPHSRRGPLPGAARTPGRPGETLTTYRGSVYGSMVP